jgi:hypothetical protein
MLRLSETRDAVSVSGPEYVLSYSFENPYYIVVQYDLLWLKLFIPAACDSLLERDRNFGPCEASWQRTPSGVQFCFCCESTLWSKKYFVDLFPDHIEFSFDLEGACARELDNVRYFEGTVEDFYEEPFTLTKHFIDGKTTPYRQSSVASPVTFAKVFNPEPNNYTKQVFEAFEYSQISAHADLDYCGNNSIFNPGLLCFAVGGDDTGWVTFGLLAEPGEYHFSEYEYIGGTHFGLSLNYWGAVRVEQFFRSPRLVLYFSGSAEAAVARYAALARSASPCPEPAHPKPDWWSEPIICGWGHQCYTGDLFRIHSSADREKDLTIYSMSTETNYRAFVDEIDRHDLPWRTLIIDAKWTSSAGVKQVDRCRWPRLGDFVDELHGRGKRVLLYWDIWDTTGFEARECITFDAEASRMLRRAGKQNRQGRIAQYDPPLADGRKLAPDPTLVAVQERLRAALLQLLGAGPGQYNLDGFKLDHVSATPGLYGMRFPAGSQRHGGIELVHTYLGFLYRTAKAIKPECLVNGQSPHPYFADCLDMLRLGDLYGSSRSVVERVLFRARMARLSNPGWLIHMDGWPISDLAALREYVQLQPSDGVPSLYYATCIDTTGERIEAEDFQLIRTAWIRYLQLLDCKKADLFCSRET